MIPRGLGDNSICSRNNWACIFAMQLTLFSGSQVADPLYLPSEEVCLISGNRGDRHWCLSEIGRRQIWDLQR